MPVAITTALTILDWVLSTIPATLSIYAKIAAVRDDLKAKHAAGEQYVSADIFAVVEQMKANDADLQAEVQKRKNS